MPEPQHYIDISRRIWTDMLVYPGNPVVSFEVVQRASEGVSALTRITLGSHTGTHIDAPSHIHNGDVGTAVYELEQLCGEAELADLQSVSEVIRMADLPAGLGEETGRLLLRTRNSQGDATVFEGGFVALDESAAQELVRRGVRLVGIDGPSIKKKGVKDRTHEILLDAGVVIIEGLWLAEVTAGRYELFCLPLPLDLDGAPVRAVLRTLA